MLLSQTLGYLFAGVVIFWLGVLTFFLVQTHRHYQKLTHGVTKKDLKTILNGLLKSVGRETKRVDGILAELEELKKDGSYHIQKIGLVRYNPFAETGGNQSFCLSVLDEHNSGLVISSLHSRGATRVYAKPVKNGKATGYDLSDEEKKAIKEAKRIK